MTWTCRAIRIALLLCAAPLGACFHTQSATAERLAALRPGVLPDDVVLDADEGAGSEVLFGGVRLDPNSNVRLRRADGTTTPWFNARALEVSDDGLFVTARQVPWTEIQTIVVTGLEEGAVERLRRTAPAGCTVSSTTSGLATLEAPEANAQAWIQAFLAASDEGSATVGGRWTLRAAKDGALPPMDGAEVRAALEGPIRVADGIRWFDLAGAEVSNLDGGMTFLAIVGIPLSLAVGHVPLVGEGVQGELMGVPALEVRRSSARVVGRTDLTAPRMDGARPLFSRDALRKASVRWVIWTSATSQLTRAEQVAFTVGAAARMRDVFELGLGAATWWRAPFTIGGRLPGPPLRPGPEASTPTVMALIRAIAHLDVDPSRRVALPVGMDAAGAIDGTLQLRLRYGVRIRPAGSLVIALYPFNAQYTALPPEVDSGADSWTFPWSLELAHEF